MGPVEIRQPLELRLLGLDGVRRATLGECLTYIRAGVVIHVMIDRRKKGMIRRVHGAGCRSSSSD